MVLLSLFPGNGLRADISREAYRTASPVVIELPELQRPDPPLPKPAIEHITGKYTVDYVRAAVAKRPHIATTAVSADEGLGLDGSLTQELLEDGATTET